MRVYRVKDWAKHYENNRTAEMKVMRWVPFPNTHDGDGYTQLVSGEEGAAMLGAWVACVQVASKCDPRGGRTPMRNWHSALNNWMRNFRAGAFNGKGTNQNRGSTGKKWQGDFDKVDPIPIVGG